MLSCRAVDLATGDGLAGAASAQAAAEGIPDRADEIERSVRAALGSSSVRAAVESGRYWREVYVAVPIEGVMIEGFIDLLYETPEGLVVVDYKTDRLPSEAELNAALERYRLQGAAYALALNEALRRAVARCRFVFVSPAGCVEREVAEFHCRRQRSKKGSQQVGRHTRLIALVVAGSLGKHDVLIVGPHGLFPDSSTRNRGGLYDRPFVVSTWRLLLRYPEGLRKPWAMAEHTIGERMHPRTSTDSPLARALEHPRHQLKGAPLSCSSSRPGLQAGWPDARSPPSGTPASTPRSPGRGVSAAPKAQEWGRTNPGVRYNRSQVGVRGLYTDNEWTWGSITGCLLAPSVAAAPPLTTP